MKEFAIAAMLAASGGMLFAQHGESQPIKCIPRVNGCAETERGMATRAGPQGKAVPPYVAVTNGTIRYYRAIRHVCCRKAEIQSTVDGHSIVVFENRRLRGDVAGAGGNPRHTLRDAAGAPRRDQRI